MTTLLESIFETIDTYIDNKLTKSNRHAAQPLFPHENGDRRNLTTSDIVEIQNDLRNLTETLYAHTNALERNEERLNGHNARISKTEQGIRYLDERLDNQRLRLDEQLDNQRKSVSES